MKNSYFLSVVLETVMFVPSSIAPSTERLFGHLEFLNSGFLTALFHVHPEYFQRQIDKNVR